MSRVYLFLDGEQGRRWSGAGGLGRRVEAGGGAARGGRRRGSLTVSKTSPRARVSSLCFA